MRETLFYHDNMFSLFCNSIQLKCGHFNPGERHERWCVCVFVCVFWCYSQVGERWQVFEGSLWYQWYVVTMERPEKGRERERKRGHRNVDKSLDGKCLDCLSVSELSTSSRVCRDGYSQQTEGLEPVERPHWYAAQAVVAQDSLHTE